MKVFGPPYMFEKIFKKRMQKMVDEEVRALLQSINKVLKEDGYDIVLSYWTDKEGGGDIIIDHE